MKRIIAVCLCLYSSFVLAGASEDFKAAFKALSKNQLQQALPLLESGFSKLKSGETVTDNELLNAKIGLATIYVTTGKLKEARDLVTPLLKPLEKDGPKDLYTAGVQVIFYVHMFLQEDAQALDVLVKLIELQKDFSVSDRANSFSLQALIQDRNGDTLSAITSQQQVISLYKAALPGSLNDLLSAYAILIDYSEKIGENKTVLKSLKDKLALMEPHSKRYEADIYNTRIRIDAVEKRIAQQGPDVDNPHGVGMLEMLARQGSVDIISVQKNLIQSIDTFGEDSPVVATAYAGYADTLSSIGEADYALQMYEIAHQKFVQLYGDHSPNLASLYLSRGNARKLSVSFELDMPEDKRKLMNEDYRRAIDIYSKLYGDAHPLTISAIYALYESERLKNDYKLIFNIAKRLFTAYSEYEKASFTHLSRKQKLAFREQYKEIGQRFIEASWLSQAKAPEESWFGEPYPDIDFSKPDWKEDHAKKVAIYENKIAAKKSKKQRTLTTAFEAWINHKGSINAIDNTLTLARQNTNRQSLRAEINNFFSFRKELTGLATGDSDWQKQQTKRNKLRNQLEASLNKLYQEIPELNFDNKITVKALQKRIPKNAIYLDFVKLYTYQYAVFSLDAQGEIRLIRLGDDQVSIEQRVKKIRNLINDTIDGTIKSSRSERLLKKELATLYDKTIGQIAGVVSGFDELIISADGLLALMPMGLLYDETNKQYLIEKHSIRTVPSARALIRQSSYKAAKNGGATIFADPDFDLGSSQQKSLCDKATTSRSLTLSVLRNFDKPCIGRLPATAEEAKSINTILNNKSNTYLQSKATEEALTLIERPDILHIATHGFFLPDPAITNPLEKSGLIFSGANTGIANKTGKGVVTGLKLASMDLRGTQLVVLSACETGVGDIEQGEGVAGLNQAFLRAGAQGVVMSLWRVPDVQTAELMKRFYQQIRKGDNPPSALRKAQRSFIKDGKHPLAWAAFAYSG